MTVSSSPYLLDRISRRVATSVYFVVTNNQPVLIWDGDCAFCSRCVKFVERRIKPRAIIISYQKASLDELGLTDEQCSSALQWVDIDGRVVAGSRAVAALLRSSNGVWQILGALIDMPIIRLIAAGGYQLVARNRKHLPGGKTP